MGRLGKAGGLYLHCRLDGHPYWALVNTGATISLVPPETLPDARREPTNTQLKSVTGQKMGMKGKRQVSVGMGSQKKQQEFWLADIDEACIVGLDLLAHWGASVNVPRSKLNIGQTTHQLHTGGK